MGVAYRFAACAVIPTRSSPLLLSILAAALLFGCATPAPLVRLHPNTGEDVFWMSGRAAVKKQSGGVQVAAAFEHQLGKRLGLRVEVRNGTGERIEDQPGLHLVRDLRRRGRQLVLRLQARHRSGTRDRNARRAPIARDRRRSRRSRVQYGDGVSQRGRRRRRDRQRQRGTAIPACRATRSPIEATTSNHVTTARCRISPPGGRCGPTRRCAGAR